MVRRPVYDGAGREVVGLLGICRDVTRQAERETRYMRSIAEGPEDAVLVIDAGGRLIRRNETQFVPRILGGGSAEDAGAPTDELTGILDTLHPEDVPRAQRAMRMTLAGRGTQRMECRVKNAQGRYSTLAVTTHFSDEFFNEPRMYVVARPLGRAMHLRRAEHVLERLKRAHRGAHLPRTGRLPQRLASVGLQRQAPAAHPRRLAGGRGPRYGLVHGLALHGAWAGAALRAHRVTGSGVVAWGP